jgi:hypothetical protein
MPAAPSLVLAAPRHCWERLRDESGARAMALSEDAALEEGSVRWIPLSDDDLASGEDTSDGAWSRRLRSVAATPQAPLVLLWTARQRGEAAEFLKALDDLGQRMIRLLQRDRVPARVAAVIFVAERGLDGSDATALETVACAGRNLPAEAPVMPAGLAEMLGRRGRPVYLMSGRTRVSAEGRSWAVADIWPIEVARLMASVESSSLRQPGLRAWRSVRFNPTRYPFERIELEAYHFTREAIGVPLEGDGRIVEGQGRQLPVLRVPEGTVPLDCAPQHCADSAVRSAVRPTLPSWWDLPSVSAEGQVSQRTDTFGSRGVRSSAWFRRFDERGSQFISDRRERSLESLEETLGPKAVQSRAWQAIHDDPALPNWFGSGQFYAGPDPRADMPSDSIRRWAELSAIERRVIAHRSRAAAEARELDTARAHFCGLGWRFVCASAASVFIATVFASLFRNAGWKPVWMISAAAAAGAIVASAVILWLEVRAGRRGRDAVERGVRHSEAAIADSFLTRMRIGAEGERTGRRRRWFQAAARTRDVASRLKAICDIAEIHALRRASADAPELPPALSEYVAATTLESADGSLPIETLRRRLREDPRQPVEARRREYAAWWSDALRTEDPYATGAIRQRAFGPKLTRAVAEIVDGFRRDMISLIDRIGSPGDSSWMSDSRFSDVLGPSGDLRNLGVQTQRAKGREPMRTVWVHGLLRRHVERALIDLRDSLGHVAAPQPVVSAIDRWGCLGLMVDEITIGFRGGESGVMCEDPESGVCVWEGTDRRGPVAEAGDAVP